MRVIFGFIAGLWSLGLMAQTPIWCPTATEGGHILSCASSSFIVKSSPASGDKVFSKGATWPSGASYQPPGPHGGTGLIADGVAPYEGWKSWATISDNTWIGVCYGQADGEICQPGNIGYERKANVGGPLTQCSDGVDNDADGLIDLADPDCVDSSDDDESGISPPSGSATLTWIDPVTKTDGTPLNNLNGINVYRSLVAGGPYTEIASLIPPATQTYTDVGLSDDTYYFVVSAENTLGGESSFSNEVSKTIVNGAPADPEAPILLGGTLNCQPTGQPNELICQVR